VLVVASVGRGEVLERWVFNVAMDSATETCAPQRLALAGLASRPCYLYSQQRRRERSATAARQVREGDERRDSSHNPTGTFGKQPSPAAPPSSTRADIHHWCADHGQRHLPAAARRALCAEGVALLCRHSRERLLRTGTFDLLVYTDAASAVPSEWEESDPRLVSGAESVRLRSFSTRVHKVETCVAYKADDESAL